MSTESSQAEARIIEALGLRFSGRFEEAKALLSSVIDNDLVTMQLRATALVNRAQTKAETEDFEGAITDLTSVIEMGPACPATLDRALFHRGKLRMRSGDLANSIRDFDAVVNAQDSSVEVKAAALSDRSKAKRLSGDITGCIEDGMELGLLRARSSHHQAAIDAFTAIIEMPDVPDRWKIKALGERASAREAAGDRAGAFSDGHEAQLHLHQRRKNQADGGL